MTGFFVVEPCNSSGGFEIKLRDRKLDLARCGKAFESIGSMIGNTGIVLLAKVDGYSLSVYGSGRIMVKSVDKKKKPKKADIETLASKMMDAFVKEGALL
jgi:hypothetical protein